MIANNGQLLNRENVVFESCLKNMTQQHRQGTRTLFKKNIWKAIRAN